MKLITRTLLVLAAAASIGFGFANNGSSDDPDGDLFLPSEVLILLDGMYSY